MRGSRTPLTTPSTTRPAAAPPPLSSITPRLSHDPCVQCNRLIYTFVLLRKLGARMSAKDMKIDFPKASAHVQAHVKPHDASRPHSNAQRTVPNCEPHVDRPNHRHLPYSLPQGNIVVPRVPRRPRSRRSPAPAREAKLTSVRGILEARSRRPPRRRKPHGVFSNAPPNLFAAGLSTSTRWSRA